MKKPYVNGCYKCTPNYKCREHQEYVSYKASMVASGQMAMTFSQWSEFDKQDRKLKSLQLQAMVDEKGR